MKPIFFIGSAHKIVTALSNRVNYISKIGRETGGVYAHITKVCNMLEDKGIVTKEKHGRKVLIKLTKKGERIKELLLELKELTK